MGLRDSAAVLAAARTAEATKASAEGAAATLEAIREQNALLAEQTTLLRYIADVLHRMEQSGQQRRPE